MEARYLRVKGWGDFQHYRDKEPGWIKLYAKIRRQNDFLELGEATQWQLVRIWLYASQSSRHVLDEEGRKVPAIPHDEKTLRVGIGTLRRIPLAQFVRDGWLVPVAAAELLDEQAESSPGLDNDYSSSSPGLDSSRARAPSTETKRSRGTELGPSALAPVSVTHSPSSYEGGRDFSTLGKLAAACHAHNGDREKLERAARGLPEAALIAALEACKGPGVNDRLAVALSELKKRRNAA